MSNYKKELVLDCMSYLWTLSKRAEDYWQHVASMEREEALSYFHSLVKYPTQLGTLFGQMSREEQTKIYNCLQTMTLRSPAVTPGFFELSLWATLIDVKSSAMRREFFRLALAVDSFSRRLMGASSEMRDEELLQYIELAKKYISLSKHIHPAFSHSDRLLAPAVKKEAQNR